MSKDLNPGLPGSKVRALNQHQSSFYDFNFTTNSSLRLIIILNVSFMEEKENENKKCKSETGGIVFFTNSPVGIDLWV